MKKYILLSIALFLLPFAVLAWNPMTVTSGGAAAGAPACDTLEDAEIEASVGVYPVGIAASGIYQATKFIAGNTEDEAGGESTYTACKVVLYMTAVGNGSDYHVCFYTDSGGTSPNTQLDCSDDVSVTITSETAITFDSNLSQELTHNGVYWLAAVKVGGDDASNYANWHIEDDATSVTYKITKDADGTGTWSAVSNGKSHKFEIYQ